MDKNITILIAGGGTGGGIKGMRIGVAKSGLAGAVPGSRGAVDRVHPATLARLPARPASRQNRRRITFPLMGLILLETGSIRFV
jgi:hypothetical protein